MRFSSFIFKNLWRRRVRTSLTITGVAVAVAAVVALVGIAHGLERSFLELYDQHGVDLIVLRAGVTERLTSALDESLADRIQTLPGVREVAPALMDVVSFQDQDLYGVVVQGWPVGSFMFRNLKLQSGRPLSAADARHVILGGLLAKNLGKQVGDVLEIVEDEPFEVVGIYESRSVYENGAMIVPLTELQRLMDRPHQVTGFNVIASTPGDTAALEQVRQQVRALGPSIEALVTNDFVQGSVQLRTARALAWATSAIAVFVGAIGMLNTMIMSVFERTQEIGILRAIGWRPRRVLKMILGEALCLSVTGALVGCALGAALVALLSRLPQSNGLIAGRVPPQVYIQGVLIALIVGLLGGFYPAQRGARLLPTEALRHD